MIFITASCKKESSETLQDSAKANFNFLKSAQASNEADQLRSSTYSASFEITKVERIKDMLYVKVTFQGNCAENQFEVIWNGLVLESYPEIIILYLKRTSTNCSDATVYYSTSRVLTLDMTQSLGDAALAQRATIILCNASKKAKTENSDITVSNN